MSLRNSQAPGGESQGLDDCAATDTHSVDDTVPCERCGRPLTARQSVQRRLGPVCCQAVAA